MIDPSPFLLPLSSLRRSDLAIAGGKGANLGELASAGFPVPPGFVIITAAYRRFVEANQLQGEIDTLVASSRLENPSTLDDASRCIRILFDTSPVPPDLISEIVDGYKQLISQPSPLAPVPASPSLPGSEYALVSPSPHPLAVRSSATTEDLPGFSFAGQQDTYLNIIGQEAMMDAVRRCWGSLWTARAITYRLRNHIDATGMALAVVVQTLIPSEASGVLFTANPITGNRSEIIIDATFGLGEALVSGQVEPDHFVLEAPLHNDSSIRILESFLGAKSLSIHPQEGGGVVVSEDGASNSGAASLTESQIYELARLGRRVEAHFGSPQDIEWAYAGGKLYLLQSRPITSLYPTPAGMPPEPLKVLFSVAAIQGMLDPFTPLGLDALRLIFATGAGLFGRHYTPETQTVLKTAGERLWIDFTPVLHNRIGRKVVRVAVNMVEPAIGQALEGLWDDPALQPGKRPISARAFFRLARFFLPLAGNILLNILSPERRREYILAGGERVLSDADTQASAIREIEDPHARLARAVELLPDLALRQLPTRLVQYISLVAAGVASFNFLRMLASHLPGSPGDSLSWSDLALEATRAVPHNPTTEMDLSLWEATQSIRRDPASLEAFSSATPGELARQYLAGALPAVTRQTVAHFLERYGGRGLCEIDLGRPRWREDPTHIFEAISGFLRIGEKDQSPDKFFAQSALSAQTAVERIVSTLRRERLGWLKARLARFFAGRMRALMGGRESPKFFAVRMMAIIRWELLDVGASLADHGELSRPDDLLYLSFSELRLFAARQERDWQGLISCRRETFYQELQRRQVPRLLLSDGRAFYEGLRSGGSAGVMTGSPVSPGVAEGLVRVVFDPRQANLQPGDILVCPGTDPSWTPLFLSAAGLVMEVGGIMTHGAVVAREYGIPAVVGVNEATRRLHTGQHIRVDGTRGEVVIIE